jgi:hypothetical protein
MARFAVPDGWTVQAFQFALDCTPEQAACLRRQFGGRRFARNWAVRTLKEDITAYQETGEETEAPVACRPAETLESGQGHRMHGCRDRGGVVAADQQGGIRRRHQSRRERLLELADFPRRNPPRQAGGIPSVREEGPRPGPGDFHHRRDPHRT